MELLSLTQLFGEGAIQTESELVIYKNSLVRLTPSVNNTPESLLAAILLTALQNFQGIITTEDGQPITDENNQPITFDNSEAYEFLKVIGWKPFQFFRNNQACINSQIIVFSYAKNQ